MANKSLQKTFSIKPLLAFRKNKGLKQLIGENTIQMLKIYKKQTIKLKGNLHLTNLEYGHCVV